MIFSDAGLYFFGYIILSAFTLYLILRLLACVMGRE